MKSKQTTYKLTQDDLRKMVNESLVRILSENQEDEAFLGIDFGIDEREENRRNTILYSKYFKKLAHKVDLISNEIARRAEILQIALGGEDEEAYDSFEGEQLNEWIGKAIDFVGKGLTKFGTKVGEKTGRRIITGSIAASIAANFAGIPQSIADKYEKFRHPGRATAKEVSEAYGDLTQWVGEICQTLETYPEIIGAAAVSDEVKNGPQDPESGPWITAGQAAGLAVSIGSTFLGPIGVAAGLIFDAIDIIGGLVSAGAFEDQELLKVVKKQHEYVSKAVSEINKALTASKHGFASNQRAMANGGYPSNYDASADSMDWMPSPQMDWNWNGYGMNGYGTGKRPLPQGYAMNRQPSNMDAESLARFQNFVGVPVTRKWDRQTNAAWNTWLQNTYEIV